MGLYEKDYLNRVVFFFVDNSPKHILKNDIFSTFTLHTLKDEQ